MILRDIKGSTIVWLKGIYNCLKHYSVKPLAVSERSESKENQDSWLLWPTWRRSFKSEAWLSNVLPNHRGPCGCPFHIFSSPTVLTPNVLGKVGSWRKKLSPVEGTGSLKVFRQTCPFKQKSLTMLLCITPSYGLNSIFMRQKLGFAFKDSGLKYLLSPPTLLTPPPSTHTLFPTFSRSELNTLEKK